MTSIVPRKAILTNGKLEQFPNSKTCQDILVYIKTLDDGVVGVKLMLVCKSFGYTHLNSIHSAVKGEYVPFWLPLARYIGVTRILQSTDWPEPAGSHGVMSIDPFRGHTHTLEARVYLHWLLVQDSRFSC